jgi:hypothetical protein
MMYFIFNLIQIVLLIIFIVKLINIRKKLIIRNQALESENKKIRENYNNTLKDLIASYHMIIAAHDGHLTIEEINDFINKPTQNASNN